MPFDAASVSPSLRGVKMKRLGLWLGPLVFALLIAMQPPETLGVSGFHALAVAAWMVLWWVTEAVPIPATALLPVVLFPLADVSSLGVVLAPYASPAVFLTLGGFMVGMAMERWHLHTRIALHMVRLVGSRADRIIAGFMAATAFLSMWISGIAAVAMMLPVAASVARLLLGSDHQQEENFAGRRNFGIALMLGLAYAASIGGMGTPIGAPTNIALTGFLEKTYEYSIDFVDWMRVGVPLVVLLVACAWLLLTKILFRNRLYDIEGAHDVIERELSRLGRMSRGEKTVACVFALMVALWVFRDAFAVYVPPLGLLEDASIAILGALLLFVIPVDKKDGWAVAALGWRDVEQIRWGVLILLGGALSMATALHNTGVTGWLGVEIATLRGLPPLVAILAIAALMMLLTEFMSSVAALTAFLPIVAALSTGMSQSPLLFAIPATFAASCAFMLPVATPPNAIVYGSGYLRMMQMVKAGFWLNLIAMAAITLITYTVATSVFSIEFGVVPDWVNVLEN